MNLIGSIDVGTKNCAYVVIDRDTKRIVRWRLISIAWQNMDDLSVRLKEAWDAEDIPPCARMLVERQPGRNKTMVRVEAYLCMYFLCRGFPVTLYHAVEKLKNTGAENRGRSAKQYRARKHASVTLAQEFLKEEGRAHDERALRNFHGAKKKDDMADALMQALSFIDSPAPTARSLGDKVVKARAPTEKQLASGRLTKAGIRYQLEHKIKSTILTYVETNPFAILESIINSDAKLKKSFERHYRGPVAMQAAATELELLTSLQNLVAPQSPPHPPST